MLVPERLWLLAGAALVVPAPLLAQPTIPSDPAVAPPPVAKPVTPEKRVYTLADFARFAPKTAYDMLSQVPGFTVQSVDTTTRGLGQASENVLINGQRVANKLGAVDQLQRTPASNVERIEIVEAASVGIAGLTGQVANVILKETKKGSGQFEYRANARAHFTKPEFLARSISYSGKEGPVDYTLSVTNGSGRGGIGGRSSSRTPTTTLSRLAMRSFTRSMRRRTFRASSPSMARAQPPAISSSVTHLIGILRTYATRGWRPTASCVPAQTCRALPATWATSTATTTSPSGRGGLS